MCVGGGGGWSQNLLQFVRQGHDASSFARDTYVSCCNDNFFLYCTLKTNLSKLTWLNKE